MKKVILIIRDGWGHRLNKKDNPILETKTPNTDYLTKNYPHTILKASGPAVGLPNGYQGNSEVGHMTIGSGRIIFQSLERINQSIKDKSFFKNIEFKKAIQNCKKNNSNLNLIGLLQTEGVHSHIDHLFAILDLCKLEHFYNVNIHIITDGRDSPVTASINNLKKLINKIKKIGFGNIVSISGRYYAMDRNKRWERTKKAYEAIVNAKTKQKFIDPLLFLKKCHKENQTDEFIFPSVNLNYNGFLQNDSVIFFNFRTDRPRQLTQAIVEKKFNAWKRKPFTGYYVCMTQYYKPMNAKVAFNDVKFDNLLGEVISKNNLKQLGISETEKYAHVTFFFNCQIEKPFKNEKRILIPSPKIETYDLLPEMSAYKISKRLLKEIITAKYDFIVTNLVNGDMVGHTGNIGAIKKAVKTVDDCVGEITKNGLEYGYDVLILSDHGNCEDKTPRWKTSHTLNPVPFILVSNLYKNVKLRSDCGLCDVAPTILELFGIKKPKEMVGKSIIKK